jgi:four helix bundle protein
MDLMIYDVRDLEVYRLALTLLKKLYLFLRKVPKSEYDSVRQCKRASKGIPAHIAEGFAKRSSVLEFKRFLKIAIGTSDEIITHLRTIAIAVPKLTQEAKELAEEYKILSKKLNKLHSVWRSGYF